MALVESDDFFTIVNRSKEYRISKKLIRKIPYFEKMLSHDTLESKENKVLLDFDEKTLKWILKWVECDHIFIEMDYVINLCNIADYFEMDNRLMKECATHFHENFSLESLPVVIPQVTLTSKLMNSGALNAFICRYFTKIVNTTFWNEYPIETIKYICALDLMVYAEIQVFNAIIKWVNFNVDSRKCHLVRLLELIRWCHLNDQDLSKIKENEFVKSCEVELKLCSLVESDCNCGIDRTKQSYFIAIEKLEDTDLRIKLLDDNFLSLVNQLIKLDESLSLALVPDEHVSDVFFDSGRKMIRIDWKHNKYRLLAQADFKAHFTKFHEFIFEGQNRGEHYDIEKEFWPRWCHYQPYESSLLEADDKFILIRNFESQFKYWAVPTTENIITNFSCSYNTYLATVLHNNIYMLTNDRIFRKFNIDQKCEFKDIGLGKVKARITFGSSLLTSNNDDKVILVDKMTKELFCFNVKTDKWSSMGRIFNIGSDGQTKSNNLLTFTSTFLPMNVIKTCINHNPND